MFATFLFILACIVGVPATIGALVFIGGAIYVLGTGGWVAPDCSVYATWIVSAICIAYIVAYLITG